MVAAAFFMASCGGEKPSSTHADHEHDEHADHEHEGDEHDHGDTDAAAVSATYAVDAEASSIKWTAEKVFAAGHYGSVNMQEGNLEVADGAITGGSFIVDLTSIVDEDMEEGDYKNNLEAHLKGVAEEGTDDFFNTTEYPTSTYEITSVTDNTDGETSHMIHGNLTIKGETKEVSFPADITMTADQITGKGTMTIDRTTFGITYNSQGFVENVADDYLIKDEFTLDINLVASK